MNRNILFLVLMVSFFTLFGQNKVDEELSCYQQYAQIFEKRGAFHVEDGVYDNVIISFRQGSMAECYLGKITVKGGNIDENNMFLRFEDATYEKIQEKYRYNKQPVTVHNGISSTLVTMDDQLINVIFVKKIKPKKKAYVKAPMPDLDF